MGVTAVAPGARSLLPGTKLGKYVLLQRLARGGMAEVYLARVVGVDRFRKLVAIKLVLPHLADDERFVEMFRREAKLSAQLDHPNIAQVLDLGHVDGEYFIAIEYVHGQTVGAILRASNEHGLLPLAVGLTTVASACAGLHYAHECGLVHRDVSPANVMVRYDGTVKVLDFGIAKAAAVTNATRTGTLKGKMGYMSPEQCRGLELDRRSDVFALGILLYECTTGRRLFYGDNEFAVMNKIVDGEFDPPRSVREDYPPALETVVLRALQCEPADRYPTAADLQRAIEEVAVDLGERLSTLALAEHMRTLFGEPDYPATELGDTTGSEGHAVAASPPIAAADRVAPPRSRAPWIVAAAATAGLLGGGAWVMHERNATQLAQDAEPTRAATPEPSIDAAPTPAPDPTPDPTPAADPEPKQASDADANAPAPTRAPASKKRKPRRKKSRQTEKTDRNAFFPEGS